MPNVNRVACRYALIQFLPYTETGEFANVGVLLVSPETGFFGFELQLECPPRLATFFGERAAKCYPGAVEGLHAELLRQQRLVAYRTDVSRGQHAATLFSNLTHPREAALRFGDVRAVLVADPAEGVRELFRRYVNHCPAL